MVLKITSVIWRRVLPAEFKALLQVASTIWVIISAKKWRVALEVRLLFVLDLER